MGFSTQGGHQGHSQAFAGDQIDSSPVSFGGPVQMGSIRTGDKQQTPGTSIGPSQSSSGFSMDLSGLGDMVSKFKGGN